MNDWELAALTAEAEVARLRALLHEVRQFVPYEKERPLPAWIVDIAERVDAALNPPKHDEIARKRFIAILQTTWAHEHCAAVGSCWRRDYDCPALQPPPERPR